MVCIINPLKFRLIYLNDKTFGQSENYTMLKTVYNIVKKLTDKTILTVAFVILLLAIIFSRYSSGSILNGENFLSLVVYFGGILS